MRISYNWIKDLLPDLEASPAEVAEKLTMHSFETDVVDTIQIPAGIKVMKITKIKKHPDADRLQLATISDGQNEATVVCGAPNIAEGQVVPYSSPGTVLQDDEGNDFEVKEATIRGVKSPGMLNSLRELGLHQDHSGIWQLPVGAKLGSELNELIPDDTILEADITPNRAHDCLSHIGIAREVAALYGIEINEPNIPKAGVPELSDWELKIEDTNDVAIYLGSLLENLTIAPAPLWMQARLLAAGSRPISNIVDITNYVMLEVGNPTHTFDAEKLPGKTIGTRRAKVGETITLIDQSTHKLNSEDIVVTSNDEPVILGGVMGGAATEVDDETTSVFLEVANFRAYAIQKTSAKVRLITEGSKRWVKHVPTSFAPTASNRTIQLLKEHAGAKLVGTISAGEPAGTRAVELNPDRVTQQSGQAIEGQAIKEALQKLRFDVDDSKNPWQLTVPADRLDVQAEHDVVEEVVRMIGLETIGASLPESAKTPVALPPATYWQEVIRDTMVELGFTETLNYSFEHEAYAKKAGATDQDHVSVVNPQAPELAHMRVSLLPGLLKNLETNKDAFQRNTGNHEQALFEIGNVYVPGEGGRVPGVVETTRVAAVAVGSPAILEGVQHALNKALGIDTVKIVNCITPDIQQAVKYRLPLIGFELELAPIIQSITAPVPSSRSLAEVKAQPIEETQFVPLPKYPSVYRDLSVIVASGTTIEQVQEKIERVGGTLVADVDLFDEYQGKDDKQSYAFHIEYRSDDKTLESEEVAELHNKIVATLQEELEAEIRE